MKNSVDRKPVGVYKSNVPSGNITDDAFALLHQQHAAPLDALTGALDRTGLIIAAMYLLDQAGVAASVQDQIARELL